MPKSIIPHTFVPKFPTRSPSQVLTPTSTTNKTYLSFHLPFLSFHPHITRTPFAAQTYLNLSSPSPDPSLWESSRCFRSTSKSSSQSLVVQFFSLFRLSRHAGCDVAHVLLAPMSRKPSRVVEHAAALRAVERTLSFVASLVVRHQFFDALEHHITLRAPDGRD